MNVSIVIPAHNEEGNLEALISELMPVLAANEETHDYELVIVNDNSTDSTPLIIEKLASKNSRIKPVHRHSEPGFGNAVREGFRNATKYGKRLLNLFFIGNIISLRDLFGSVISGSKLKLTGALVFGILVLIGIFSFSGYSEVYGTIKNTSLSYVFLGFLAITTAFFMRTWRWSVLLRTSGYVLPRDILFKSLMFGFLLNYLLPARAGDIARGAALKIAEKTPMGISLSTIVIERAMDMFTLALMLGAGAMLVSRSSSMLVVAIAALAIAFLLVMMLVFAYKYDKFISRKLGKRFPAISGFMNSMKEGLYKIYYNQSALILAVAISIPVWLFEISGIYIASMAIGYKILFSLAAVAGITSFLAQTIPITPGGGSGSMKAPWQGFLCFSEFHYQQGFL